MEILAHLFPALVIGLTALSSLGLAGAVLFDSFAARRPTRRTQSRPAARASRLHTAGAHAG